MGGRKKGEWVVKRSVEEDVRAVREFKELWFDLHACPLYRLAGKGRGTSGIFEFG